jgi:tetratricopeptide (TPR) repeat protein
MEAEANLLLGISLEQSGHFHSARAVYEFTAEIAPKNPEALKRAGAMMHRTGDHLRALEYYERALEADPRDQEALKARKNLAAETALSRTGQTPVAHSRELIKDKDRSRELERSRRLVLSEEELRVELTKLEERQVETPNDPELLVQLSDVHEKLGDPTAALEFAERALQYRKDSFELLCRVGDLESKRLKKAVARADKGGRTEEAGQLERELIAHEVADQRRRVDARPGDPGLRLTLAKRLLRAGEVDLALGELQRCSGEPRVRDEALFFLGQCFQQKGILDLAQKEYEHALQTTDAKSERAKEILYNLGTIAEAQGKRDSARSYYIRIYEIDIGYRDVAAKMGTLST